jgi:hypothetical protein
VSANADFTRQYFGDPPRAPAYSGHKRETKRGANSNTDQEIRMNDFNEYFQLDAGSMPDAIVIGMPSGVANVMPTTSSTAVFGEPANDEGFRAA